MKQKIIKVGNSVAVTIPVDFVREAGYKVGDVVLVEHNAVYRTLMVKPKTMTNPNLTPEFFAWLDKIGKKYEKTIKELALK